MQTHKYFLSSSVVAQVESLRGRMGESSTAIRARVQTARDIQNKRVATAGSDIVSNADKRVERCGSSANYKMKVRA